MVNFFYSEKIREHIIGKSWLNNFVTPDYNNYCISNLPTTLCIPYKLKLNQRNTIDDPKLREMLDNTSRIIILVIDSLSYYQLSNAICKKTLMNNLPDESILIPLTSTFPSTTPTALTTLNTGLVPEKHGILGYSVYLKDVDSIVNMVRFSPSLESKEENLNSIKLDPTSFLEYPTIYEILKEKGVCSYVITKWNYKDSSLTKMIHKGANIIPYISLPDFFIKLRKLIETKENEINYIFGYWDQLDTISHVYGPESEESYAEIYNILHIFMKFFFNQIKKSVKNTLLILTSDHGHHSLMPERTIMANAHPELLNKLQIPPTGSSRASYLYPKTREIDSIERYFKNKFKNAFFTIRSEDALKKGLFGSGSYSSVKKDRIGDLIVLSKNGYSFFYPYTTKQHVLKGGHGGLSQQEMLLPLLCINLNNH
jgi:predicted AlkP superfamily pyrophosphatase or phosphodiesterase